MAKTTKTAPLDKKKDSKSEENNPWRVTKQHKIVLGSLLVLFSIALLFAFISFYIYGQQDQSAVGELTNRTETVHNWLGKFGAFLADLIVYKGFGLAAFIFVRLFFLTGMYMVLSISLKKLKNIWFWDLFVIIILSVLFGFFATSIPELGGTIGYELNLFLQDYIGKTGTLLILLFGLIIYVIFKIKISPEKIQSFFDNTKKEIKADLATIPLNGGKSSGYNLEEFAVAEEEEEELDGIHLKTNGSQFEINKEALKPTISNSSDINRDPIAKPLAMEVTPIVTPEIISNPVDTFVIETAPEEDIIEENLASRLVADFGLFDPTLDLSNYKFPTIDLLKEYSTGGITINQEELEENKNRIVDTLRNYKIEIAQIKATVGPSVTLYEIVPEAGIRISKIKSLEDDIALSLSALGIRIIAPIPGKGTIGIEVPNKNPTMVSMKSVIGSAKFQEAEMELPIALGKTISNET
ncbi:MAG: DNA translocase FtsK 4TM domain-containing protein, partial [bacterium]|nr:DNA translocase FtsK 4TM domain-containing protein [bacterium]